MSLERFMNHIFISDGKVPLEMSYSVPVSSVGT